MWSPNVAALAEHHPVFCLDVLGQPGASVQRSPLRTAQDCADWLSDVLAARGLLGVHLVGCSYGGWLALNQAINAPGRLATITLIEPANVFAPASIKFKPTVLTLLPAAPRWLTRRAMSWAFGHPGVGDPMDSIVELIVDGVHNFRGLGTSPAPRYPSDEVISSIDIPTLVLLGGRSAYHDAAAAAARARRLVRRGHIELWASASHAVAAERADEVNARILEFVGSITPL